MSGKERKQRVKSIKQDRNSEDGEDENVDYTYPTTHSHLLLSLALQPLVDLHNNISPVPSISGNCFSVLDSHHFEVFFDTFQSTFSRSSCCFSFGGVSVL